MKKLLEKVSDFNKLPDKSIILLSRINKFLIKARETQVILVDENDIKLLNVPQNQDDYELFMNNFPVSQVFEGKQVKLSSEIVSCTGKPLMTIYHDSKFDSETDEEAIENVKAINPESSSERGKVRSTSSDNISNNSNPFVDNSRFKKSQLESTKDDLKDTISEATVFEAIKKYLDQQQD